MTVISAVGASGPGVPRPGTAATRALVRVGRLLLGLRYRAQVSGLDEVGKRGRTGIVFLPNHPALADPVLMVALLHPEFAPRTLADEHQVDRPVIRNLARMFGVRTLPNLERKGFGGVEETRRALEATIEGLKAGENVLLYPAGRLKRQRDEDIGATSAVEVIVREAPDARVVLVRQNGLWGSSFSFAFGGAPPQVWPAILRGARGLLTSGVLFAPRRRNEYEFVEPADFPRGADRMTINAYLERFYNAKAAPNTYVPYSVWEKGGIRVKPEPETGRAGADAASAPSATRQLVLRRLAEMSGRAEVNLADRLAQDLGMDSLAVADLAAWLEHEFGFAVGTPDSLQTAGDVVLAAAGRGASALEVDLKPVSPAWFATPADAAPLAAPAGDTITTVFLKQAARNPGRVIVADQLSGARTYRDIILAVRLLAPLLAELPGDYVGLMFPASVGASIFYLAALFAGKTPVMVNWTTGSRNLLHSLDLLNVQRVVSSRALLDRLQTLGLDLGEIRGRIVFAEDLRARMSPARKLAAFVRTRISWRDLRKARLREEAVVLFTSGSESLPKAAPLTHGNLAANVRDLHQFGDLLASDAMIGMLPPFHSFGLTATVILPLCYGLRVVYHPNPNEAAVLAQLIQAYRVTMMVGTPTFLGGILRTAKPGQLDSLRLAVTGAEKCPAETYSALEERCPRLTILEGYGITECSPVVSVNTLAAPVRYSIGRLMGSLEGVLVHPETGRRVAHGEIGMLLVRGPSVFGGYLNYDGPPPFVTFEGREWYRTGDLVRQREDGVLFFEGRLKRFVKLGGEMISLPAVESVLAPHFPEPDDEGPMIAVEALGAADSPEIALFTRRPIERSRANDLLRAAGLSPLHFIRQVIEVERIPVLGTGKTDYRTLKDLYAGK